MAETEKMTVARIAYLIVSGAYCAAVAKHFASQRESIGEGEEAKRALLELAEREARKAGQYICSVACELIASLPHESRLQVMAALHAAKN